jgi:hypothetical protein
MDDASEAGDEAGPEARDRPAGTAGPETDFRALAEDWIAIWQSEITAYLTDPETQQAWSAMVAVWSGAAQAMMRAVPPTPGFGAPGFGAPFGQGGTRPPRRPNPRTKPRPDAGAGEAAGKPGADQSSGTDAAPGPAPAAPASVARDDEVRRLEQRVAELERHLAERDRAERDRAERERRRGAAVENRRARRASRPRS